MASRSRFNLEFFEILSQLHAALETLNDRVTRIESALRASPQETCSASEALQNVAKLDATMLLVAREFGLKPADLSGRSRAEPVATARLVCYHLLSSLWSIPSQQIAAWFRRERSGVSFGLRSVRGRMDVDPQLADQVARIQASLGGL